MLQKATSTLWCGWARWPAKVKALRILVSPCNSGSSNHEPGGGGRLHKEMDGEQKQLTNNLKRDIHT